MRFVKVLAAGVVAFALPGAAMAVDPAGMPDGTFASTEEGCKQLEKTPPTKLTGYDFEIFTNGGLQTEDSRCDFVNVLKRDDKGWVATAFCEQQDFSYPDVISVQRLDDERLRITKLTEVEPEPGADPEIPPDETDNTSASSNEIDTLEPRADQPAEGTDDTGSTDDMANVNVFFACRNVAQ